jgi:6-phosphogluconolactonase (cycloisomerase 2 family)
MGNFLFASNSGSNDVSVFSIDPSTGLLSLIGPFPTGGLSGGSNGGISLAATPDGKFLMAGNAGSNNITVFSIAANGGLTQIAGSPFPAGGPPDGMKMSPNGEFLASGLWPMGPVAVLSLAGNGTLTPVPGSPFQGSGDDAGIDISCSGNQLFAGNAANTTTVDVFSIAANGALTPIPGSPFEPGVGVNSNGVLLSPDNQFLFVSNQGSGDGDDTITVFNVAANGFLTLVPGSPFPVNSNGGNPSLMATNQAGTFLFTANYPGSGIASIGVFSIAANGFLTEVGAPVTVQGSFLEAIAAFPAATCTSASSFTISASPTSLSVAQGNQGTSTITTAISGGFNSAIALSASGAPSGTTVSFNPNPIPAPGSGNSTMTITVGSSTPVGTYPITVTGNGGGIQQNVTVTLTVPPPSSFTISASPTSLSVAQGNQGTSTITTAIGGGFNSAIALSASGAPSGTTVSFNPNPIPAPGSGNSTMTITVGLNTPIGIYSITVTGNGGGIQQNVTVTLTVPPPPSFTISTSPTSLSVAQGNQGTSTITTAISGGFNSAIALSASGAPSGTTVSFNPNPIPAPGSGNSTMTITAGLNTPGGTYPITVTGNGGGIQQAAIVTLTLTAAPTCAPPVGMPLVQPGSDSLTVVVTASCTDTTGTITTVTIDWGDGSPLASGSTGAHTYAAAGTYTITVTATNNFGQKGSIYQAVTLTSSVAGVFQGQQVPVPLSFTLPQNPGKPPQMVNVGFTLALVTLLGSPEQQAMPCDGQHYGITCSCSPTSGTLSSQTGFPVTLTLTTTGATTALLRPAGSPWLRASLALWMPLPAVVLLGSGFLGSVTKRSAIVRYVALGLVTILLLILTSCGGSFTPPAGSPPPLQKQTPPGNYLVTIGAVDSTGFVQTSLIVPLTVTGTP